ncbi:nucleotidyltransferase domain-containing protein [Candidatus Marsarchaeota archaeon]|nr:nucleotidyltransferase domain-containing protein [Candidatus Marsarchaeota archaeon]
MSKVEPKIMNIVKRFKEKVANRYGIKRIILFGSAARGEMKKDSDIDLMVVVKKPVKRLIGNLSLEWHISQGIDYPVDFIGYTERDF